MKPPLAQTTPLPLWIRIIAVLGVLWNLFGLYQLYGTVMSSAADLVMMKGMSAEAARVYASLPAWMNLCFALGAGGGVFGSAALLAGRSLAVPVLLASLGGYVLLFLGDLAHGLFDLIPAQLGILSSVVGIAAVLLAVGLVAWRRAMLR